MTTGQRVRAISRAGISLAASVVVGLVSVVLGASSAIAAPPSIVIKVAEYAVATAAHERPAHAVTSEDITNAAAASIINASATGASKVSLVANIGDLPGYPRVAAFLSSATFALTCVDFPASVGAAPVITPCPSRALGEWYSEPTVLLIARNAVALAASRGQAVSVADVVAAAARSGWKLAVRPTFSSGQGGVAKFTTTSTSRSSGSPKTVTVTVCVLLPATAYGIAHWVNC